MPVDELDTEVARVQSERAAVRRRTEQEQKRIETETRARERSREDDRVRELVVRYRDARATLRAREAELKAIDGNIAALSADAADLWARWMRFCGSPRWHAWRQESYILPSGGFKPDQGPPPGFTAEEMATLRKYEPLVKQRATAVVFVTNANIEVSRLEAEMPELAILTKE
jgi:hypothetical protein